MQKVRTLIVSIPLFLFISFSSPVLAGGGFFFFQQEEHPKVDSILAKARQLFEKDQYDESLAAYLVAIKDSEKENYSKGLATAYLGISGVYYMKGKLDLSTSYIVKAKKEPYARQNPEMLYSISFREALSLHILGLYDEAIKRYKEAIQFSGQIKEEENRVNKLFGVYVNLGDVYQLKNQKDSALYYYKAAYFSPTTNLTNKFTSAVSISDLFVDKGELDSSKIYLGFAEEYSRKMDSKYSEALLNEITGKYYDVSGNFQKAIVHYQKSLELNKEINNTKEKLYKLLSEAYYKEGHEDISNIYLKKYVKVKDSLEIVRKQNAIVPAILIKSDTQIKVQEAESNTRFIFLASGLVILGVISGTYIFIKSQRRKSLKGKRENLELKKKLNNAFEEIVSLANENSPNFLSRFIEVYPEFYNQLVHDYPDLTSADLKLCALMKLDFSTKEIAEMTFSSLRTVQNRKYKLRKKFRLSSEENLNQWVQNLQAELWV